MNITAARRVAQNQHGITLIELLVVMAITSILIAATFAGYRTFDNRQRVKQAALNLKNNLRLAQTKAIAVDIPTGCDKLTAMMLDFDTTNSKYQILYDCDSDIEYLVPVELPNGVSFTNAPDVTFTLLSGKPDAQKVYTLTSGSVSFTLTLTADGVINCTGDDGDTALKCI